ncbi:Tim44/TimA family putative adaptor protein [Humitalea sp. 24SJ18S-53]|uniref:Tim44/TimA family putative adaptor protein n=1 Tax=Humitalea sp. 24SJ18S-53 TaxID=3422307 RepID=UPI003D6742F8
MQGGFPIDLILFGMVAAFLVLRLRGVLGKRTGFERPPVDQRAAPPAGPRAAESEAPRVAPAAGGPRLVLPDASSPMIQTLTRMQSIDPGFEPNGFMAGAEGAFRMIVEAFAAGDRVTLRSLLSDDTYAGFEGAITQREQANETQRTEIRSIQEMGIEAADLRGTVADVAVRIVSDQVNVTTGGDGLPVAGADAVTEITDVWTFQRDLAVKDPTWRLIGTRSA